MRATMSSGSSTHSSVRPRQNSPGWMTNGSSSSTTDLLGQVARRARAGRSPSRDGCGTRGTSSPGAGRRWRAAPSSRPRAPSRSGPRGPVAGSSRRRGLRSGSSRPVCHAGRVGARPGAGAIPQRPDFRGRQSWLGWRALATTVRVRAGGVGADPPCGPRRGLRGSGPRGWTVRRAPPSPCCCSVSSSGTWCTAHQTMYSSSAIGIFSTSIRYTKVQPFTVRRCYPPRSVVTTDRRVFGAEARDQPRRAIGWCSNVVIRWSSPTRAVTSSGRRSSIRSVPNASTLNEASAVP